MTGRREREAGERNIGCPGNKARLETLRENDTSNILVNQGTLLTPALASSGPHHPAGSSAMT